MMLLLLINLLTPVNFSHDRVQSKILMKFSTM